MKSALKITGVILALIFCALLALMFLVDANSFKPRIEALAKEKGIALAMRGDLHWAFWPAIGLAVNDVSVAANETPDKPIAEVTKASLLVAFMPLIRGDIQVKHVLVDGANIVLEVDEQGVGNWEKLIRNSSAENPSAAPKNDAEKKELKLAIEKISIENSQLSYSDLGKGSRVQVKNLALNMKDVNLNSQPFAMDVSSEIELTQKNAAPLLVKNKLQGALALNDQMTALDFTEGKLNLEVNAVPVALSFAVKAEDLKTNLRYQGKLNLASLDAKKLLAAFGIHPTMANDKALTQLSASANFSGTKKDIVLKDLQLNLDKTHLQGSAAITNFASKSLVANLTGDEINVDDYLAPKPPENQPVAAHTTTGDEPLIPLEPLRSLNLDVKVGFKTLTIVELPLAQVQLDVDAKNGLIEQQLSANAYSGNAREKATLDARGNTALIRFDVNAQGIEVAPILKDKKLDKNLHLSGAIKAVAQGQASGTTKNQIMESLLADVNFSGAKMQLAPINIEQQFCKFIALVNHTEAPEQTWNTYTELRDVAGKIHMEKRVVTIENVTAGVEKLSLGTKGFIDLGKGGYDFMFPLKLVRDANDTPSSITTSAKGCTVTSNYWAERSMTLLRCKGAYAQINPAQDCRPDKELLVELTKDYAEFKIKEKHGAKLEAKKEELMKKLDDKLGGEGKAEKAKDLLKNLLKKKDDK